MAATMLSSLPSSTKRRELNTVFTSAVWHPNTTLRVPVEKFSIAGTRA